MTEKLAIIGSGPADLTAAIYAARANLEPLMIEGLERGSGAAPTTQSERYRPFRRMLVNGTSRAG